VHRRVIGDQHVSNDFHRTVQQFSDDGLNPAGDILATRTTHSDTGGLYLLRRNSSGVTSRPDGCVQRGAHVIF
jgi:hypothetical protein